MAAHFEPVVDANCRLVAPPPTRRTAIGGYPKVAFYDMLGEQLHYSNPVKPSSPNQAYKGRAWWHASPVGRRFLAAWVVSTSFRNIRQKPNLPTWTGNPSPRCSARAYYSANALFRAGRCAPVRAHRQQVPKASSLEAKHRRPRCKQDECTSSSHRAVSGTRQKSHCTCADKLTIPCLTLTGSFLSRKHCFATFVHDRIKWTLVGQSPNTSETEWLCVDVDGYRIVNVYKPPPTRLQASDLPMFPHPVLYAGDFNCPHVNRGYRVSSALLLGQALTALSLSTTQRTWPPFILAAGTLAPTLIWHLSLKLAKSLLPPDSPDVGLAYEDFCNVIRTATKNSIPRVEITTYRAECENL